MPKRRKASRDTLLWKNLLGRSTIYPSSVIRIRTTILLEEFSMEEDLLVDPASSICKKEPFFIGG